NYMIMSCPQACLTIIKFSKIAKLKDGDTPDAVILSYFFSMHIIEEFKVHADPQDALIPEFLIPSFQEIDNIFKSRVSPANIILDRSSS
ncbi:unnamed protein product, partial [marine sediment metagenome]